jgi:cytochrome c peroxidase
MGEGREFVPRNSPDIFNRGSVHWTSMFWDSRVSTAGGVTTSPAGAALPGELVKPLQIQAMFPPTSRDEMRGSHEDVFNGNEVAAFADDDLTGIWEALFARIMDNDIYRAMFLDAFPEVDEADLGFQHAAIALAAFETEAFGMNDSPFDEFLRGNTQAMSRAAKRGAFLFYGKAGCVDCHSGTLLTDQLHHNLAVPQIGPGKNPLTGLDHGRMGITADPADEFAFRTPPLRNVAATGPWMHNGAFSSLEDVIEHHLDPKESLRDYRARLQLVQPDLIPTVINDRTMQDWMLDTAEEVDVELSRQEKSDLVEFLHSLTAPDLAARLQALIPASVPSGMLENGLGE